MGSACGCESKKKEIESDSVDGDSVGDFHMGNDGEIGSESGLVQEKTKTALENISAFFTTQLTKSKIKDSSPSNGDTKAKIDDNPDQQEVQEVKQRQSKGGDKDKVPDPVESSMVEGFESSASPADHHHQVEKSETNILRSGSDGAIKDYFFINNSDHPPTNNIVNKTTITSSAFTNSDSSAIPGVEIDNPVGFGAGGIWRVSPLPPLSIIHRNSLINMNSMALTSPPPLPPVPGVQEYPFFKRSPSSFS